MDDAEQKRRVMADAYRRNNTPTTPEQIEETTACVNMIMLGYAEYVEDLNVFKLTDLARDVALDHVAGKVAQQMGMVKRKPTLQ